MLRERERGKKSKFSNYSTIGYHIRSYSLVLTCLLWISLFFSGFPLIICMAELGSTHSFYVFIWKISRIFIKGLENCWNFFSWVFYQLLSCCVCRSKNAELQNTFLASRAAAKICSLCGTEQKKMSLSDQIGQQITNNNNKTASLNKRNHISGSTKYLNHRYISAVCSPFMCTFFSKLPCFFPAKNRSL